MPIICTKESTAVVLKRDHAMIGFDDGECGVRVENLTQTEDANRLLI